MKILYLTHRLPYPPTRGDKIRSYHFIKELSKKHTVTLLSFVNTDTDVNEYIKKLESICDNVVTVPFNPIKAKIKAVLKAILFRSINVSVFQDKLFALNLSQIIINSSFDIVIADSSAMGAYMLKKKIPFIVDFMDVDSEKWKQFSKYSFGIMKAVYFFESIRLADVEKNLALKAKSILVVSENEKKRLLKLESKAKVHVVPNGVNPELFTPSLKKEQKYSCIFTGVMNYLPNEKGVLWFASKVWPIIRKKYPDAVFNVVGADPGIKIKKLRNRKGIRIFPNVEKVAPYLEESEIAVVPIQFSVGLLNKVIEAMAMGKPVVATSQAVEGLLPEIRKGVLIAENPGDFAKKVLELMESPNKREEVKVNGLKIVQKYCVWETNLRDFVRSLG